MLLRARVLVGIAVVALAVGMQLMLPTGAAAAGRYVVVLERGDAAGAAARHGAAPTFLYSHAIRGYAARLGAAQLARVRSDPAVAFVTRDRVVRADAQVVPTGVRRIGGSTSRWNGVDDAPNVDVAILDTGIAAHPDLRIAGGRSCSNGSSWRDRNGHGTHVSGTVAARDDASGVVGVAPGARLWAVRVLNAGGSGSWSNVICGLDWVTARAGTIDVVNMSLGGSGSDDRSCGRVNGDALHAAVCRTVAAGVTVVVSAGNSAAPASGQVPAAYDEVVTVSANADFDGLPGALAAPTCRADEDDSFADFSNYGADVDVAAPGVCILSTWTGGGTATLSGTSMAAPHVTGAAALYLARFPSASPATVRSAIVAHVDATPVADDPDSTWEGLLDLDGWL